MTERPVGWAFVGTSGWVDSRFAPAVVAAGHNVVGAFGSSAEGSARFAQHYGCSPYGSLEQLLADDAVEAVWVASPTALHPEHARAAAKAGRAVLVEKPLSVDLASARLLADELASAPIVAATGFQHRFNPGVAAFAEALASEQIGTLCALTIHHGYPGPPRPGAWRTDPAQSGGWAIGDVGTHLLDLVRHLVGDVDVEVAGARLSSPGRSLVVDDLCTIMLASGEATVVVRASTGAVVPPSVIEAIGTKGWVRLTDFWTGGGRLSDSAGNSREIAASDPYVAQVIAFSAAVRGAPWTGATIDDGAQVAELTSAAHEHSGHGQG